MLPRAWASEDAAALCDERPPATSAASATAATGTTTGSSTGISTSSGTGAADPPVRTQKGSEALVRCAVEASAPAGNVPARLVLSHAQVRAPIYTIHMPTRLMIPRSHMHSTRPLPAPPLKPVF